MKKDDFLLLYAPALWKLSEQWQLTIFQLLREHENLPAPAAPIDKDSFLMICLILFFEAPYSMGMLSFIHMEQAAHAQFLNYKEQMLKYIDKTLDASFDFTKTTNFIDLPDHLPSCDKEALKEITLSLFEVKKKITDRLSLNPLPERADSYIPLLDYKTKGKNVLRNLIVKYILLALKILDPPFSSNYQKFQYVGDLLKSIDQSSGKKFTGIAASNIDDIRNIERSIDFDSIPIGGCLNNTLFYVNMTYHQEKLKKMLEKIRGEISQSLLTDEQLKKFSTRAAHSLKASMKNTVSNAQLYEKIGQNILLMSERFQTWAEANKSFNAFKTYIKRRVPGDFSSFS